LLLASTVGTRNSNVATGAFPAPFCLCIAYLFPLNKEDEPWHEETLAILKRTVLSFCVYTMIPEKKYLTSLYLRYMP
jgi:hypothetical protein